ncbi:MAG: hypothetical protein IJ491_04490 [Clostridia bacterium]|nr:hypothetical protein [Clostridia bacterium]
MKIRNKFLIPMIALVLTALMIGSAVPGAATDTTVSQGEEVTHPLTYVPSTFAPTSSFEEEIDAMVSENLGDLAEAEDEVREVTGVMGKILRVFKDFINKILEFAAKAGEFLGGGWADAMTTTEAPAETTAAE